MAGFPVPGSFFWPFSEPSPACPQRFCIVGTKAARNISGVEESGTVAPLSRQVMSLLMQASIQLPFFAAAAHCSLIESLLPTRTSRYLSTELVPSSVDPSLCSCITFFHVQELTFILVKILKVLASPLFQLPRSSHRVALSVNSPPTTQITCPEP